MRSDRSLGSRTDDRAIGFFIDQPRMVQRRSVVRGGLNRDAEEVRHTTEVAAGGLRFVDHAILPDRLGRHTEVVVDPGSLGWCRAAGATEMDEEVRIDAVRPSPVAVVEVSGEPGLDRIGEWHRPPSEVEATVANVGELQVAQLHRAQTVEGEQSRHCGTWRVGRVESVVQPIHVGWHGDASSEVAHLDAGHRIDEDHLVRLERAEDGSQSTAQHGAWGLDERQHGEDIVTGDLAQRVMPSDCPRMKCGKCECQSKPEALADPVLLIENRST